MFKKFLITVIAMISLLASTVFAHDAWIEKRGDDFVVLYGHGDKIDSYDPKKIKEIKSYDAAGKEISAEIKVKGDGAAVVPKGKPAVITMFFDNGFWVKTTDGWKNVSKKEVKEYLEASHSMKFSKAVFSHSDIITKPLGMRLEIVPMKNPTALKAGEVLPIKVFYEGKPLEGASIDAEGYHKETARTGKDGIADVVIKKPGKQVIAASYKTPLKDNPDADQLSISTNIVFEIK